jgi:hypothetical protein
MESQTPVSTATKVMMKLRTKHNIKQQIFKTTDTLQVMSENNESPTPPPVAMPTHMEDMTLW